MAFIIVLTIILIKYTPKYSVSLNNSKIGYVNSKTEIDSFINENIEKESSKNIAFVEIKNTPMLKLELVNRNLDENKNEIKEEIGKQISIEYTNYAISIDGENKVYVASKDEAQEIVDEIKEEYSEKYTDGLGIVQVYSSNYEEISSSKNDEAKDVISSEVKEIKEKDIKATKLKLAATKAKTVKTSNSVKEADLKGIKLSVRPVSGTITSRYGRRSSPGGVGSTNHKGLDIAAKQGTTIKAAASGKVISAGYKGSLGKLVIIDHGNGVQTYYGHCNNIYVSDGDTVNAGDSIAAVGKTGAATGYHLHFEVHVNGTSVNPQKFLY